MCRCFISAIKDAFTSCFKRNHDSLSPLHLSIDKFTPRVKCINKPAPESLFFRCPCSTVSKCRCPSSTVRIAVPKSLHQIVSMLMPFIHRNAVLIFQLHFKFLLMPQLQVISLSTPIVQLHFIQMLKPLIQIVLFQISLSQPLLHIFTVLKPISSLKVFPAMKY